MSFAGILSPTVARLTAKPLIVGAIAGVAASALVPTERGQKNFTIYGKSYSVAFVTFIGVAIGSLLAEVLRVWGWSNLGGVFGAWGAEVTSIAAVLGMDLLVAWMANNQTLENLMLITIVIEAIGAEIIGSYLFNNFLAPLIVSGDYGEAITF
jgi:hypothetical protein